MKTYIFLADGFEILETFAPIDILKRCGAEVVTVSTEKDLFLIAQLLFLHFYILLPKHQTHH